MSMAAMEMEYHEEVEGAITVSFHRIDELEQFGINKTDISKLKNGGFHTIEAVLFQFLCDLMASNRLPE